MAQLSETPVEQRATAPDIDDVLNLPEVKERAQLFGMDARGTTPEEMGERMKADIARWSAIIAKAGIERQ